MYILKSMSRFSHYQIRSRLYTYDVTIEEVVADLLHKVYVGGNQKCVIISVYFDGTHPNIDGLGYDEKCNSDVSLPHGTGTVDLLTSAMSFVSHKYKNTKFELKDKSYVECDKIADGDKKLRIPLMYLHIIKYGKTWYEDKFNAQPVEFPKYRTRMRDLHALLKTHPTWQDVCTAYEVPQAYQKALGKMYEDYKDLQTFIETLVRDYDCSLLKTWLGKIIAKGIGRELYNSSWMIKNAKNNLTSVKRLRKPLEGSFGERLQDGGGESSNIMGNLTSEAML